MHLKRTAARARGVSFPMRTHLSLSASALFNARTPLSLCVCSVQHAHTPLSLCVCSVQRAHTPLSLCICLVQHAHTSLSVCSVQHAPNTSLSASALFSVRTPLSLCRLPLFSMRTTSLSLYICLVQHAHTSLSVLICSACAHTSLSASALFSVRTPLSLSLCICSVQRAHTSFSASALFNARTHLSLRLLCESLKRAALSVKTLICCFSNFTCKYSRNHSTIVFILFDFIRRQHDYKIRIFVQINILEGRAVYLNGLRFSHSIIFMI